MIERAADLQVAEVDVPMVVRLERLHEPRALARWLLPSRSQQSLRLENPVHAGRADRHHVLVEHNEAKAPIPFQRMGHRELRDSPLLPGFEPVVPRNLPSLLQHLPEAGAPIRCRSSKLTRVCSAKVSHRAGAGVKRAFPFQGGFAEVPRRRIFRSGDWDFGEIAWRDLARRSTGVREPRMVLPSKAQAVVPVLA